MGDGNRPLFSARVLGGIGEVAAAAWDACAGGDNPFVSHAFLSALEESGSAAPETGWAPRHLVVEDAGGAIVGAAPAYLKSHSYGEYVFDHAWADAFERAGGSYYPKLQVAVPFTPVTGPRLMVRAGADPAMVRRALIAGCVALARSAGVSSLHVTFPTEAEWRGLGAAGFLLRTDRQFHWSNRGYRSFDDFLAQLASRKRKAVRRERRAALTAGLAIETLTGAAITPAHWDAFYRCYVATSERKWGMPYLTRAFFEMLGDTMADRVVLVIAANRGRTIAGALNLVGGDTLFGRNWGALERHRFLHFELCYYRAIDYAIERGLSRVEAGVQGPHKIARGYLPKITYSAHWIGHKGLRDAVADYLDHERPAIDAEVDALADLAPFRKAGR
jgi:hypothetical protein